jgi:allantoinase
MRHIIGYGPEDNDFFWPNKAKIAINFVINYEEGSENGDLYAETSGADFPFTPKDKGKRNLSMESFYEYGSRVGIWRLLRLFDSYQIPLTFFITGQALILNPLFAAYLAQNTHEIAGHGWRWIDYAKIPKAVEKEHILLCIEALEKLQDTGRKDGIREDVVKTPVIYFWKWVVLFMIQTAMLMNYLIIWKTI